MDAISAGSPVDVRDVRAGVRVELITVAWMLVEAALAITAGIIARSVLLTAFGFDSVIELASASILLWRLKTQVQGTTTAALEAAEGKAEWVTGIALALLCLYVVVTDALGLAFGNRPESSPVGIALAVAALIVMPLLVRSKRRIADQIDSPALRNDAACSLTCAYLAGALLVGLLLNAALGWWWADSIIAFGILYWLIPETKEALDNAREGRTCCECHPR